jgi:hypothetical protein
MPGQRGNSGGKKGRSGRKSKAEELGLVSLLNRGWTPAARERTIKRLSTLAEAGNLEAIKILLAYTYGKPIERTEHLGQDGEPIKVIIEHVKPSPNQDR